MRLDDKEKIRSINSITAPEIETIYWKLEDSLTANKKKKADRFFDMLCYTAKYKKKELNKALRPDYLSRLKKISHQLNGKEIPASNKSIEELPAYLPLELPFKKEKEIGDYLVENEHVLKNVLGNGRITGREVEIEDYKCDLVFENKKTFFAIELKRDQADHKAISQLDKYCHYFYLKLRYSLFKEVRGICIANGFCKYSVNEFRRRDRRIFYISSSKEEKCFLREIK